MQEKKTQNPFQAVIHEQVLYEYHNVQGTLTLAYFHTTHFYTFNVVFQGSRILYSCIWEFEYQGAKLSGRIFLNKC